MLKTFVRQATADDLEILEAIENEADALFASVFSIVGWRPAPSYTKPSQEDGFILVASDAIGSDAIGFARVFTGARLLSIEEDSMVAERRREDFIQDAWVRAPLVSGAGR